MDRRSFLGAAVAAGSAAVAGCTGAARDGDGAGDAPDDDPTTDAPEETTTTPEAGTDTDGGDGDGDATDDGDGDTTDDDGDGDTTDDDGDAPAVVDTSFARTGDASDPGEAASVAFGDATVECEGVIRGRNGCMRASMGAAEYDANADELRVRVTTVREGGDTCTQQIVNRRYEAVVSFEGGLPGRVVVEHESMGDVRTVAEATR